MRTFSLIWSGIGCFATVAITVLGGVILAGGGKAQAAYAGAEVIICFGNGASEGSNLNTYPIEGLVSVPQPDVYFGTGLGYANAGVGTQIVLTGATFSDYYLDGSIFLNHRGTAIASFSDDNTKVVITVVSTQADSGQYTSNYAAYQYFCFHINAKKLDDARVTAHISME
jgi:hypothetical protein